MPKNDALYYMKYLLRASEKYGYHSGIPDHLLYAMLEHQDGDTLKLARKLIKSDSAKDLADLLPNLGGASEIWKDISKYNAVGCAKIVSIPVQAGEASKMIQAKQWDLLRVILSKKDYSAGLACALLVVDLPTLKRIFGMRVPGTFVLEEVLKAASSRKDSQIVRWLLKTYEFSQACMSRALNETIRKGGDYLPLLKSGGIPNGESAKKAVKDNLAGVVEAYLKNTKRPVNLMGIAVTVGRSRVEELLKLGVPVREKDFQTAVQHNPGILPELAKAHGKVPGWILKTACDTSIESVHTLLDLGVTPTLKLAQWAVDENNHEVLELFLDKGIPAGELSLDKADLGARELVESRYRSVWDMLED